MKSCTQCNLPVFSKGLCINHWKREYGKSPRKVSAKRQAQNKENKNIAKEDEHFYMSIWNTRFPHNCAYCDTFLGYTPYNWMFDHILEKAKFPEFRYDKQNIVLTCLQCHDNKTRGILSEKMIQIIQKTKQWLAR